MNIDEYYQSLALELKSMKSRVRNFLEDRNWLTDGEWKESVLRAVLRRQFPNDVGIGRGFVISEEGTSRQIDVLIYDSTKPKLFQDGDLVFVTPDAVLGIIEVKSSLDNSSYRDALIRLTGNAEIIGRRSARNRVFGLFSYEDNTTNDNRVLRILKEVTNGLSSRIIHCISLGESRFIRFWNLDPTNEKHLHNKWHLYEIENKAQGYFINNIIETICPQSIHENRTIWYPGEGKEMHKIDEINL